MSGRDEFSADTRRLLGEQAAFRCSKPDCRRLTVGASPTSDRVAVRIGIAAHITAAAKGGPRYRAALSPERRSSPENGIWLCATCSVLIDKDIKTYTCKVIRGWKKRHLADVAKELVSGRPGRNELQLGACYFGARESLALPAARLAGDVPGDTVHCSGVSLWGTLENWGSLTAMDCCVKVAPPRGQEVRLALDGSPEIHPGDRSSFKIATLGVLPNGMSFALFGRDSVICPCPETMEISLRVTRRDTGPIEQVIAIGPPPVNGDASITKTGSPLVVFRLPRGFILLENLVQSKAASWSTVATYYGYPRVWRHGTHFHASYESQWWDDPRSISRQIRKLHIESGDAEFALEPLEFMCAVRLGRVVVDPAKGLLSSQGGSISLQQALGRWPGEAALYLDGIVPVQDVPACFAPRSETHEWHDLAADLRAALNTFLRGWNEGDAGKGDVSELLKKCLAAKVEMRTLCSERFGTEHGLTRSLEDAIEQLSEFKDPAGTTSELIRVLREGAHALETRYRRAAAQQLAAPD